MKKLYVNIEEIKIKGRPSLLSKPIRDIDERMQQLASVTEMVKGVFYKFSGSNQGIQYKKACDAVTKLSDELYDASEILNDVQTQVVKYENKIHCYEGETFSAASPRKHAVKKMSVNANTAQVEFHKEQMVYLIAIIDKYIVSCVDEVKKLRYNKENVGKVWYDRQFKDFSIYIDEVCGIIFNGCKELDEYKNYLTDKVKMMA